MSRNRQVHEMSLLRLAPYVSGARGRPDFKIHRLKAAAAAGLTDALSLSARHLWCPWAPIHSFGGRPEGANSIPLWSAAKRSRPACFNASIGLGGGCANAYGSKSTTYGDSSRLVSRFGITISRPPFVPSTICRCQYLPRSVSAVFRSGKTS
jgi:hypothetical protein